MATVQQTPLEWAKSADDEERLRAERRRRVWRVRILGAVGLVVTAGVVWLAAGASLSA